MVLLISIIVVSVAVGTALFVGWLLGKLRERDEAADAKRLSRLEEIDKNLKKYADEQRKKQEEKS